MELLGLGAVDGPVLAAGTQVLYTLAGEVLKRSRGSRTPLPGRPPGKWIPAAFPEAIFEGGSRQLFVNFEAAQRLRRELREVRAALAKYAKGDTELQPDDQSLLEFTDRLRAALEAVFQQQIIFRGEVSHPKSGADAEVVVRRPDLVGERRGPFTTTGLALQGSGKYANVFIKSSEFAPDIDEFAQLLPGRDFVLLVDVGPLRAASLVVNPQELPQHLLSGEELTIDVIVTSTHFLLSKTGKPRRRSARAQIVIPGYGGPLFTPDGAEQVSFRLRSPSRAGPASARISLYFRGAVVQSLRLEAFVGREESGLSVTTDFTTSNDLEGIGAISQRRRTSLVFNDSGAGNHRVVLRNVGERPDSSAARPFDLPHEAIARNIDSLRKVLASEAVAPTTLKRSRQQLVRDMRLLAPVGWRLYATLEAKAGQVLQSREDAIVHVCRTTSSTLTLPWGFLYDIYLDSQAMSRPERLAICPLVSDWDDSKPLLSGDPRECPRRSDHDENMLCPFGFWGFRQSIEVLSSTDRPRTTLRVPSGSGLILATSELLDQRRVAEHSQALRSMLNALGQDLAVKQVRSKTDVRNEIESDVPFVYFYCHGRRGPDGIYLAVGHDEPITPEDLTGWILQKWRKDHTNMWTDPRPLVVVNACESLAVPPETLLTYLDVLIGRAGAVGVIGTEVKVHHVLAARFVEDFLRHLLTPPLGTTVASAMHASRCRFLSFGNLFGLLYTAYCWADLAVDAAEGHKVEE